MSRRPLLVCGLAMACGIGCAYGLGGGLWLLLPALFGIVLAVVLRVFGRKRHTAALLAVSIAFGLGAVLYAGAMPHRAVPPQATIIKAVVVQARPHYADVKGAELSSGAEGYVPLKGRIRIYGDGMEEARPGQQLQVQVRGLSLPQNARNPGGFPSRRYLTSEGIHYVAYVQEGAQVSITGEADFLRTLPVKARNAMLRTIDGLWPEQEENVLMRALIIGNTDALPADMRTTFSRLGVAHVLAVSGLHVGFILALLLLIPRLLFMLVPYRYTYVWGHIQPHIFAFLVVGLCAYAVLTGLTPSVVRSCVMAMFLHGGRAWGLKGNEANTLGGSMVVLLILWPTALLSLSFQLSYAAIAAIIWLGEPLRKKAKKLHAPKWLATAVGAMFAAQLGIAPIVAQAFNNMPLLGIVANLFVVPLAGLLVMLGFPLTLLGLVAPAAAGWLAHPVGLVARLMVRLCTAIVGYPLMAMDMASPAWWMIAIYYVVLLALSPAGKAVQKRCKGWLRPIAIAVLVGAMAVQGLFWYPLRSVVTMLDVGQGHASMVRLGHRTVLVDAGDRFGVLNDALLYYGQDVDAAFITHGDRDHCGALVQMLESGKIKALYVTEAFGQGAIDNEALRAAQAAGIPAYTVRAGDVVWVGALRVAVYAPTHIRAQGKENEDMLVVGIGRGIKDTEVLFLGDLTMREEEGLNLPIARVVQVAHHGARNGTSDALLAQTKPEMALIPVGRGNVYGHPAPELMQRLENAGLPWERTDQSGAIEVRMGRKKSIKRWAE